MKTTRPIPHHSLLALLTLALTLLLAGGTWAGTVQPSGRKDATDRRQITAELEKTGTATLVKGGNYYLDSTLYVKGNNWRLNATGATITCAGGAVRNTATTTGYGSMKNFTLRGGNWVYVNATGHTKSSFQFVHASNITMTGMTISCTNYAGHAIELIACRNVTIKNCKIIAQGTASSTSVEEMVQIDLAAPATAPILNGTGLQNGAACKNIYILNNTITGCRAVCANYARADGGSYLNSFHINIVIRGNTLTGVTSEALALFNTTGGIISGNTIITSSPRTTTAYSIGCHIAMFGTLPATGKNARFTVANNIIKGGRQAIHVYSHTASKYGYVTISGNKLYCQNGAKNALVASKNSIRHLSARSNSTYDWNGK